MNKKHQVLLASFLLWLISPTLARESAHIHGTAKMQIAVEGENLEVFLVSPLENLVGFEHAPRSDKERKAVQAMMESFTKPAALLVPTAAAKCMASPAEVKSPVTDSQAAKPGKDDTHAELEAAISFRCANPAALNGMEVGLFDAFPRLQRVQTEVVSAKGQSSRTLTPQRRVLSW